MMQRVWLRKCTKPIEKLILLALADFANTESGDCFPSLPTLAKKCGISKKTLCKHLNSLRAQGVVKTRPGGGRKSTNYFLNLGNDPSPRGDSSRDPKVTRTVIEPSCLKKTKEDIISDDAMTSKKEIPAVWKVTSKETQLGGITPPKDYPSQAEFDEFCETEFLYCLTAYRPDLYSELCRNKWHEWRQDWNKWIPIRNWRKYVEALQEKIQNQYE
jgi:biotin operon repressor